MLSTDKELYIIFRRSLLELFAQSHLDQLCKPHRNITAVSKNLVYGAVHLVTATYG